VKPKKTASVGVAAVSMSAIALAAGIPSGAAVSAPVKTANYPPKPTVDATDYTLSCGSVAGKVYFSPGLTDKQSGPITMKWKVKATDCTATPPPAGGPQVTVSKLTMSGSVSLPNGDSCPGFADGSAIAGTLTYKPRTAHGSPKLSVPSGQINWGDFSVNVSGNTVSLLLPAVQVGADPTAVETGPFAGTDGGASSKLIITDGTFLTQKCVSPGGLKNIVFPPNPNTSLFLG
jgi:hypothetical protein